HHGRQRPLGQAPAAPPDRRPPRGRAERPRRGARGAAARPPRADALRVLVAELAASARGGAGADAAPARLPHRGTSRDHGQRHPPQRDRPARAPAVAGARSARRAHRRLGEEPRHDAVSGPVVQRARGDHRRGARGARRGRAGGPPRREHDLALPPDQRSAPARPHHPHQRRAAHLQFPPVGVRLRGAVLHRYAVAGLPPRRSLARARSLQGTRAAFRPHVRAAPRPLARMKLGNLALRVITVAALVPLLLLAILWSRNEAFFAVVTAACALCVHEWFGMAFPEADRIDRAFCVAGGAAVAALAIWGGGAGALAWPLAVIAPSLYFL